jgi:cytochrome P450
VPFVTRDVLEPIEIEGVTLEKGAHVVAMLGAGNHDPDRFAEADRLDISRPDNTPLTFGWGIHHCLGAPLARLELQMTFAGLRERFSSLEVLDTDPPRVVGFLRGVKELPVRVTSR